VKDELAAARCGIYAFSQTPKAGSTLFKQCHSFNEVLERPPEPIKTPDDQRIPFPYKAYGLVQTWTNNLCPAYGIRKNLDAPVLCESVLLQIMRLFMCRNPSIANIHMRQSSQNSRDNAMVGIMIMRRVTIL
jgi:hypothetical protein